VTGLNKKNSERINELITADIFKSLVNDKMPESNAQANDNATRDGSAR